MKTAIILRFIQLNRKMENPGFDQTDGQLLAKFEQLSNQELMSMYELIVTDAHRHGFL